MNDTRDKAVPSPKGFKNADALARHQQDVEKEGGLRRGVSDHRLRQPNERDTAPDGGYTGTDRRTDPAQTDMPRAYRDIEEGQLDTEGRGTPSNVPSSRDNAEPRAGGKEKPVPDVKE